MNKKRIISSVLAAALTLGTTTAFAQENGVQLADENTAVTYASGDEYSDGTFIYKELPDGTYEVSGVEGKTLASADIPATVNDKSVTRIGDYAFFDCTSLTSVTIPNSATSIGDAAFLNCRSLKSVTIPDSVTSIDMHAFCYCISLKSVTIPDSVTSIGAGTFQDCTSLTSLTIPNSVTYIGCSAFSNCTSLTSLTIPYSVTFIGHPNFYGCTSLTAINVNANNKNYCSVNGVLINKNQTSLAFYPSGKTAKSYTIPNNVTSIDGYAFYTCTNLKSVTIPNSVIRIDYSAFEDCTNLTSVTIPNSVIRIDSSAFSDCTSLKNVYYTGIESEWNKISIIAGNDSLKNAKIHYNSTGPTGAEVDVAIEAPDGVDISEQTATVIANGEPQTLPIADGMLDISSLDTGTYTFTFSAKNCAPRAYKDIEVANGTAAGLDKVELNLYGDMDGDGVIELTDVMDAYLTLRKPQTKTEYQRAVADANHKDGLNISDVMDIFLHLRGKSSLWK